MLCHLLDGWLELTLGDETHELAAGDIARFDSDQEITPHAIQASTALLVLAEQSAD